MTSETIAWTVAVSVGTILTIVGIREALRDLDALRELPRNGRWMIARHQLIRYTLRLCMYGTSIAALAVTDNPTLIAWLLIADRIGLALTTSSDLLTGAFLRRGVRQHLEEGERNGGAD